MILDRIALILTIIGALNWGLVGIFNFDLVTWMTMGYRSGFGIAIYVLIMLAGIWLIISPFITRGMLDLGYNRRKDK